LGLGYLFHAQQLLGNLSNIGISSILNQASKLILQMAGKKKDIEAYLLTF
jgi:hypothetical protein